MATAKHWTVEPDAEASVKVSLSILFWQYHPISALYMHNGIVHACVLLGTVYYTCDPFDLFDVNCCIISCIH